MSKGIAEGQGQANPHIDRLTLVKGWISQQDVDAILTLYPQNLVPKDDLNAEILEAGGPELEPYILENVLLPKPPEVHVVPGFDLPAKHIFVGIMPVLRTEFDRNDKILLDICRAAIGLVKGDEALQTLGFPLLTGGRFGYPKKRAIRLISQAILEGLDEQIEEIRIVCDDESDLAYFRERLFGE